VFDENQPVLSRCFIFRVVTSIVVMPVNIQIKIRVCRNWFVQKSYTLSENLHRHIIGYHVPSMRQVPTQAFTVMVSPDKPHFTSASTT
jgi:hypothetical protein